MPSTVAIGSSDADFSPLVVRLREAGARVICYARREKASEDLPLAYSHIYYVGELDGYEKDSQKQELQRDLITTAPTSKQSIPSQDVMEDGIAVRQILGVLKDWRQDTVKQLNQIGKPLREAKLIKGSRPLHEMFRKHPAYFKVLPSTGQPKQVKLLKKP